MKFGLWSANIGPWAAPAAALELAKAGEATGFESIWTAEHSIFPRRYASRYPYSVDGKAPVPVETPMGDPLIHLAWLAGQTSLFLGTAAVVLPLRNPVLLAKELASLDYLSGGRIILGVGVGWLEEEFAACGVPWAGRAQRAEDAIAAMRTLWSGADVSHHGPHFAFDAVTAYPQPARAGGVPIVIAGSSAAAARRAGRVGDGWLPMDVAHDHFPARLSELRTSAEQAGRDVSDIEIYYGISPMTDEYQRVMADPGEIRRYADLGVSRLLLGAPIVEPGAVRTVLEQFAETVMVKV
ncbi:TIGR03619 family F420-dependent LLM class oxidoreductase [Mycobacterium sp.]|uniref:TIGR03619 family F420-dependent LLM class oxidoreductase n=1 Tax=Mycobacterium sp. TaxID=1785 RepID=UPI0011F53F9A|nr:TIGR03619 family F420-dependent LLM class oxidoreductase [Mycobacterium sp.]TAM65729.1 MAG: TIGR03619 family F420-dependent LLM class oxidoreductase [Mycobacterium sp.]